MAEKDSNSAHGISSSQKKVLIHVFICYSILIWKQDYDSVNGDDNAIDDENNNEPRNNRTEMGKIL